MGQSRVAEDQVIFMSNGAPSRHEEPIGEGRKVLESEEKSMIGKGTILALFSALAIAMAACAPAAPASPTVPATKATPAAPAGTAPSTPASKAVSSADLYEAAKKEGQLMAYVTGTTEEWEQIATAFGKKYPGITFNTWTGNGNAILQKIMTEAKAGRRAASFVRVGMDDLAFFMQEGVLDKYLSPELKNFDQKYYDAQGYWAAPVLNVNLIGYNTKAVPKAQAPKSYMDLLKPEYKGKLAIEATAFGWFTSMLRVYGKDKGMDYMKKLAEQKPRLVDGASALNKLVVSGEIPIEVFMYSQIILREKANGAPIDWVDPEEPTPTNSPLAAVLKDGPHPNAARLLMDFLLSEDPVPLYVAGFRAPNRTGVTIPAELAAVGKVETVVIKDLDVYQKEAMANEKVFRDIFGKP